MVQSRGRREPRTRLLALQLAIVLGLMAAVAAVVLRFEDQRTQQLAFERVHTVAVQMTEQLEVRNWILEPEAAEHIAPIAHLAEEVSGVDYVVVADLDGIRVAHPDPALIGQPVSSDHGLVRGGESFRGVEEGPVGVTLRAKEPIWVGGEVAGTVSVGILQSKIRGELLEVVLGFAPWILGAAALGTLAAAMATRVVRKRIYGVEPEAVAGLLQSQEAVLFSVRDGVMGIDRQGRITLINDEARRLLGITGAVAGQPVEDVLDPDVAALLSSDASTAEDTQFVLSGERVLVATRREALAGGHPVGRTLTLQDRTELESTIRELEGQRSLADALRSQTHEFSNRLHVIAGLLAIGEAREAEEFVRSIAGSVGGIQGQSLADPAFAALVGAKAAVAREAGVEFELDSASRIDDQWHGDEDALTVTANLLTNAIEAAGDGGRVRLWVNAEAHMRLTVEDSGPGISPDQRDEVFHRGFSSKPDVSGAGRGVGLALVDRIIRRRGGTMVVGDSELGGALFKASWPASPPMGRGISAERQVRH